MVPAAQAVRGVLETSAAAAQPSAWLLAAVPADEPGGTPLGYAMLVIGPSGPTWDLGELTGEIESLAVAEDARGCGVGGALIAAARATLRERGVLHWHVGVVGANAGDHHAVRTRGLPPLLRHDAKHRRRRDGLTTLGQTRRRRDGALLHPGVALCRGPRKLCSWRGTPPDSSRIRSAAANSASCTKPCRYNPYAARLGNVNRA